MSEGPPGAAERPTDILSRLVRFMHLLRRSGLRLSASEEVDALEASILVDWEDRQSLHTALRATLVKRTGDVPIFDRAFALFFAPREEQELARRRFEESRREREERRRQAREDVGIELSDAHKDIYAGLPEDEKGRIVQYVQKSKVSGPGGTAPINARFEGLIANMVRGKLEYWRRHMENPPDPLEDEPLPDSGDTLVDGLAQTIRATGGAAAGQDSLLLADMKDIREKDLPKMEALIASLARRLATGLSRRYEQSRRRKFLDLRKSVRYNIRYGGVFINLKYRARRPSRPQIVLLCDVSGSMARYARFIMQFIFGLTTAVSHIESFVFADDLEQVTQHFRQGLSFERAMVRLMDASREWGEGTNLGRALETLRQEHAKRLQSNAIVIIVSDARTVAVEKACAELMNLRRQVRGVVWLNTLPRRDWGRYPAISQFQPHCRMFECYSLHHLQKVLRTGLAY